MRKDVMAPVYAGKFKTKRLHEVDEVTESNITDCTLGQAAE